MKIYHIAAITENNVIGLNNDLVVKSKEDLQNFKKLTTNQIVVMGRKTFESLNNKPLPNRLNIVISSDVEFAKKYIGNNLHWMLISNENKNNLSDILLSYLTDEFDTQGKDVYIIGGGVIYKQTMKIADELIISKFPVSIDGDTFYPEIGEEWKIKEITQHTDFNIINYIK